MAGTRSPGSKTRKGTYSSYAPKSNTTKHAGAKSAASRQNIKRAQVSRVGSHNPYKRTAMRR